MPMTDDERREALVLAESLGPIQIAETLEDLIVRERALLDATEDEEMRAITLHNMAVLTAACAGYREAAEKAGLPQAEQAHQDVERGGVDGDAAGLGDDDVAETVDDAQGV